MILKPKQTKNHKFRENDTTTTDDVTTPTAVGSMDWSDGVGPLGRWQWRSERERVWGTRKDVKLQKGNPAAFLDPKFSNFPGWEQEQLTR